MYARSTTLDARRDSIDRGIAMVRDEIGPELARMPGCKGVSMVVDRVSGRSIVTTSWASELTMRDSRRQVRSMRDRAAPLMQGPPRIEEWEVGMMHRRCEPGEGACARIVRFTTDPGRIEQSIDFYRMVAVPMLDDMAGFCSASLFVNRESGVSVSTAAYASREAMDRTRERMQALRDRFGQAASADFLELLECELVLAHLNLPQMR